MIWKLSGLYLLHGKSSNFVSNFLGFRGMRSFVLFACFYGTIGFYLPGLAPVSYCQAGKEQEGCNKKIELLVNRLTSHESVIPFEYNAFDFCKAKDDKKSPTENLGQVLFGERIRPSPYEIEFDTKGQSCTKLCTQTYDSDNDQMKFLKHGMMFSYEHHWIIDNMPVAWCYNVDDKSKVKYPLVILWFFFSKISVDFHMCKFWLFCENFRVKKNQKCDIIITQLSFVVY